MPYQRCGTCKFGDRDKTAQTDNGWLDCLWSWLNLPSSMRRIIPVHEESGGDCKMWEKSDG